LNESLAWLELLAAAQGRIDARAAVLSMDCTYVASGAAFGGREAAGPMRKMREQLGQQAKGQNGKSQMADGKGPQVKFFKNARMAKK
jgi:hypothetical protein